MAADFEVVVYPFSLNKTGAGSIIAVVIILGLFILGLPWWLCVTLIVVSVLGLVLGISNRKT